MRMIRIQKAEEADASGILHVHKTTWLDTYPNNEEGVTRSDIETKITTFTEKGWRERLQPDSNKRILVAKQVDQVVGFTVGLNEEVQTKIGAIYVLKEYQHSGIGTDFMNLLFAWLPDNKPCIVHVVSYNQPAISFYNKHGFLFFREEKEDEWLQFPSGNRMRGILLQRPAAK